MKLDEIIAISSRPGLFKILSKTRSGFIAQSLFDDVKISTKINDHISILDEINIFGINEEKPLNEIFKFIFEKENGFPVTKMHKASKENLMSYFSSVYENYDVHKVYANDVKKIISWYNILHEKGFFDN